MRSIRPCKCKHTLEEHNASLLEPEYWQWPNDDLCSADSETDKGYGCSCEQYIPMTNLEYLEWLNELHTLS